MPYGIAFFARAIASFGRLRAAAYESALPQVGNEATRQHISGLIAFCKGNTQGAIWAFEPTASIERQRHLLAGIGAGADGERGCDRL
jgi:hypothetical protein